MSKSITREAKLFESGDYQDKGITVSENDLDSIVSNFVGAEIKIEHNDSAFDGVLGFCSKIWRKGKEIYGNISFPDYVWELMNAAEAKKLSVGLSKDKSTFTEISIVKNPRVSDAQVFCFSSDTVFTDLSSETIAGLIEDAIYTKEDKYVYIKDTYPDKCQVIVWDYKKYYRYNYTLSGTDVTIGSSEEVFYEWSPVSASTFNTEGDKKMPVENTDVTMSQEDIKKLREERDMYRHNARLTFATSQIDKFKREGKITPASEEIARHIFMCDDTTIKFNNTDNSVAQMFTDFLEKQPKAIEFSETTKNNPSGETTSTQSADVDEDKVRKAMKMFSYTREQATELVKGLPAGSRADEVLEF